jgi:5-methylcytosine-specific restriction endonuclease McrA
VSIHCGKLGIVRRTGKDLEDLRRQCYDRDRRRCVDCHRPLIWERGALDSMHMAHIVSRGAGGSDSLDNVRTKCFSCHIEREHAGYKLVPAREVSG